MTTKRTPKPAAITSPVTAPAIAPDEAFEHELESIRDCAVVAGQAARNDILARQDRFDREVLRLTAEWDTERKSLEETVRQQERIQAGCNAALEALKADNVVPLKAAGAAE